MGRKLVLARHRARTGSPQTRRQSFHHYLTLSCWIPQPIVLVLSWPVACHHEDPPPNTARFVRQSHLASSMPPQRPPTKHNKVSWAVPACPEHASCRPPSNAARLVRQSHLASNMPLCRLPTQCSAQAFLTKCHKVSRYFQMTSNMLQHRLLINTAR